MKKHLILDLDGTLFEPHALRRPYPDALEFVRTLEHQYTVSLLTAGKPSIQWNKLAQCGIIDHLNTVMIVPEAKNKREGLASLMSAYPTSSADLTIVVGDRVDIEIALANEFGCTSVWIRRGKYESRAPSTKLEKPKHTISSLVSLPKLIATI